MVLLHSKYEKELHKMVEEVRSSAHNAYVEQYVKHPEIDLFQTHFIFMFLTSMECSADLREAYCVSQMYIQLGLDSHDLVGLENVDHDNSIKSRQLTVLSGDFFSSYYYYYLAKKNQIELIRKWSEVIKEINISKADLHQRAQRVTQGDFSKGKRAIRGKLAEAVLTWFHAPAFWYDILSLFNELRISVDELINHDHLKSLMDQLDRKLTECPDPVVRSECKIWLDKIQQEHLAIKS